MKVSEMEPRAAAGVPSAGLKISAVSCAKASVGAASIRTYVLVACIAAASLGLELIQTRILSFLYYNHVVYLTVTIALLGFGISGVFVSLFASRCVYPERAISLLAGAFAIASYACVAIVSRIPEWSPHSSTITKLIVSYVALTVPFLLSGGVLGWIFMVRARSINRLYAVDLACSSGAVLAFLLFLWPLGGDGFVWLCTGAALVGFLVFSHRVLPGSVRWAVVAVCALSLLLLNRHLLGVKPESYKTLARAFEPNIAARVETTQWTPITRIDLWSDSKRDLVFGTTSPDPGDSKMITQDADAFTMLWGPHRVAAVLDAGKRGELISALSLTYLLNKTPDDALVIGVGGGIDMVTARAYGAKRVTGVEINPATVSLDVGPYRNFVQWPNWDGVKVVRAEGRNYLRSRQASYDTIVMSGVDTFSALNSGAYVLSENYLYTVEAIQDYLGALKPHGTVAIYRWFFFNAPRESLRLASIFQDGAERMAIPHPEQCIMVISEDLGWGGYRWAATFVKKEPFTQSEVREVMAAIRGKPTLSIVYLPKVFPLEVQADFEQTFARRDPLTNFARQSYDRLLTSSAQQRAGFIRNYQYRIDPVYDDRPFFFEYFKPPTLAMNAHVFDFGLRNIRGPAGYYVLYILLAVCGLICVSGILVPLWVFQRRGLNIPGAVQLLLFFACLGSGYMMFEVGAMQVLNVYIGEPAYSLALVLSGLLVASGIGAALSGRWSRVPAVRVVSYATAIIAAAICTWLAFVHVVHPRTMQFGFGVRALIVVAALLPVGIILGFPFPTAVRELEKYYPNFIAWAWGVNGITSVLASIVAIVVAMRVGFTLVVVIAAATYLLGLLTYRWHSRALG